MDDYIKRADAVNAVCELALSEEEAEEFAEAIENLPGVEVVPVEDGRYIRAGEISAIVEDGKPVGFYRPDGPEESEAEHRAEVFERMAFKLEEELRITKEYLQRAEYSIPCGLCLYMNEESDGEHCWNCTRGNANFVFYAENEREEE